MIADHLAGKRPTAEFQAFYEATAKVTRILMTFLRMAASVPLHIITVYAEHTGPVALRIGR